MRMVEQFFDALTELVSGRYKDNVEEIRIQLSGLYEQYLGNNIAFFYNSSIEGIIAGFLAEKDLQKDSIPRMEMLAELFYQDALVQHDAALKRNLLEKSLTLFNFLAANSHTYSIDRPVRIEAIQESLSMLGG